MLVTQPQMTSDTTLKMIEMKIYLVPDCGIVGRQKEQYVECGCVALRSLRPLIEL